MKIYFFVCLFVSIPFCLNSQSKYEIYCGPSISNVKHILDGEQVVYKFKENAPLWNIGFQLGITRSIDLDSRFKMNVGGRFQLKGDLDGEYEIFPDRGDLNDIRFVYFVVPVNMLYKLLPNRDIFLEFGISPDYLLYMNSPQDDMPYFPNINTFLERLGLSAQLGYKIYFGKKWAAELLYSQSLTNITSVIYAGPSQEYDKKGTFKNQAFEFTLYFGL